MAGKTPKQVRFRLDLATVLGIAIALGGILGGLILEGGRLSEVLAPTALLIVLGGTLGAVLVTTPQDVLLRSSRRIFGVFFEKRLSAPEVIEEMIVYATKARKSGIVSLELDATNASDPFLRKALSLAVDGTDLGEVRKMMELEITLEEQRGEAEARVFESAGGYSPTIGIIGAVLGLIQVMKNLANIDEVGHGIATAFVATIYGVGFANVFFLPAAAKIRARLQDSAQMKEMMLEGVVAMVEGQNPKLIRAKLDAYYYRRPPSKVRAEARAEKETARAS
ncbi:MAG: flagellar motor protein [Bryobacterales bacterium]|nr:flagellar motor protein [Bryobacterales bacterium]